MGNTVSISHNILFFADPIALSRERVLSFRDARPDIFFAKSLRTSYRSSFSSSSGDSVPSTPSTCASISSCSSRDWPRPETSLACYEIASNEKCHGKAKLLDILWSLCYGLRVDMGASQSRRGEAWRKDYHPRALFHIKGDFHNLFSNSVLSILLEKVQRYTTRDGSPVTIAAHSWIHIYEASHLARGFATTLQEFKEIGITEEVKVDMKREDLDELEATAWWWAAMKAQYGDDWEGKEKGEEVTKRLEAMLWAHWFSSEKAEASF